MAFLSRFYNSKNGDRTYNAADWADYFASFISNGVFAEPANGCKVVAVSGSTNNIKVRPGKLWINGYYSTNTTDYSLSIPLVAEKNMSRYDRVVARLDLTKRTTSLAVLRGTAATVAEIPQLTRNDTIYELGLAIISVRSGTTEITQADITDTRMIESDCGIVKGVIDQIKTDELFAQYQAAFEKWFSSLQTELDENALTHLYTMIQSLYNSIQALNNQLIDDVTKKQYHLGVSDGRLYYEEGAVAVEGGFTALSSDKNYIHNQTATSAKWVVQHNLGKYCSVTVVDSGGNIIVGNVEYVDINRLIISFSTAISGKAYCN